MKIRIFSLSICSLWLESFKMTLCKLCLINIRSRYHMRFRACWVIWKLWLRNEKMISRVKGFKGGIILKKKKIILMCWGLSLGMVWVLIQIGKRVEWCTKIVILHLKIIGKKLEIMKLLARTRSKLCRVTKIRFLKLSLIR